MSDGVKCFAEDDYKYFFNTDNGLFLRYGATLEADPKWCPYGPEILDCEVSTKCSNGCAFCSPANTKINTPNGLINIENLKRGDYVLGYDDSSKQIISQKIEEVYNRQYTGELVKIEFDDHTPLYLTPEHQVLLTDGSSKQAGDLLLTDELIYVGL
jgi:hypothetical protein